MVSILAVALAVQFSPSANEAARGDLEFVRGVEEFVIAAEPGRRPPEPYRGLIERLGSDKWREREDASRGLQAASAVDQALAVLGPLPPRPRGPAPLERDPSPAEPLLHLQGHGQLEELGPVAVLGLSGDRHGVAVVDVGLIEISELQAAML